MEQHGTGGIISIDERDYTPSLTSISIPLSIPKEFSFIVPQKRDQNGYSTCGAHTIAEALEIMHYNEYKEKKQYSAGFAYGASALQYKKGITYSEGMSGSDVGQVLCNYGSCEQKDFPYEGKKKDMLEKITATIKKKAIPQKALSWIRICNKTSGLTVADNNMIMATMMATNAPIYVIMTLYRENFVDAARETGIVLPFATGMKAYGEHVMCCIGWKMIGGKQYYILTTHWGDFGDNGLVYLPIDYNGIIICYGITDYIERPFRCSAVYDQEKTIQIKCLDKKNLKEIMINGKVVKSTTTKYKVSEDGIYVVSFTPKKGDKVIISVPVVMNSWAI